MGSLLGGCGFLSALCTVFKSWNSPVDLASMVFWKTKTHTVKWCHVSVADSRILYGLVWPWELWQNADIKIVSKCGSLSICWSDLLYNFHAHKWQSVWNGSENILMLHQATVHMRLWVLLLHWQECLIWPRTEWGIYSFGFIYIPSFLKDLALAIMVARIKTGTSN